jgi:putative CocE/NonD family hydrolase
MSNTAQDKNEPVSATALMAAAARGDVPTMERMPQPDHRLRLPMRDGVRLDTQVWLPERACIAPVPAILLRTPYKESVLGFKRLGVLRYVQAGYALVIQMIRGVGGSEGRFSFNAPHERNDGYDTVEWIAAQPWCGGDVGMDGSSYLAMTAVLAAIARPPHLRCIVPAVPSLDFFREPPYPGGMFCRQHTMRWAYLLQIESIAELGGGFMGLLPLLADPAALQRMSSRPAMEAADGLLHGDYLDHYRDVLAHPTFDGWWRARTASAEELAAIDIPTLVVSGNFDLGVGPLTLWRAIEARAGDAADAGRRQLLIGPWDHGQCYSGGGSSLGPYDFGEAAAIDLGALRLAFFDRHLKGQGEGPDLPERVTVFITGANEWRGFDAFPPREVSALSLYLSSGGRANSSRGDGQLLREAPPGLQPPDHFIDDPALPHISALLEATGRGYELHERERDHETLVYDSGPLTEPVVILGEGSVELFTSADAPDADLVVFLAEHRADGSAIQLAGGQLRLRYRDGFDAERALTPGDVVQVQVPLTYIGHRLPAGSRLRLLVCGSNFPFADPNPHSGEPVATAVAMRRAAQTVFHDVARPSRLILPVLA